MSQHSPTYAAQVDEDASFYLARIRQIDKIVEGPVKTLIGLAELGKKQGQETSAMSPLYFPTWISPDLEPKKEDNRLTQAVCCGTLQRVRRFRRRFSWLDKDSEGQLNRIRQDLVESFTPQVFDNFDQCADLLDSKTFGSLNPLTASQVFRILLNQGEDYAHSGIGFLAFFAMIWPLSRSFPSRLTVGARIEPWEVTAYVTAKCLLPIRTLQGFIARRAQLYDDIANNLHKLGVKTDGDNPRDHWLFNIELDDLSANLSHLSQLAINKKAFQDCAESIQKLSTQSDLQNKGVYDSVLEKLVIALKEIRRSSVDVLSGAKKIVGDINDRIAEPLRAKQKALEDMRTSSDLLSETKKTVGDNEDSNVKMLRGDEEAIRSPARSLNFNDWPTTRFADEHVHNSAYWKDLADAAEKSIGFCKSALAELEAACKICPDNSRNGKPDTLALQQNIIKALADLARANRKVKDVLNEPVQDAALWCRNVVDREIAHASAENFTDFDPSELVSAIAVAVGWNLMTTPLQVSDAVTKAIAGARKDGSWRSGKPFYSSDHASGTWAMTSDIVWTLTSAIEQFPGVREADQELFNFINWLERTQIRLPAKSSTPSVGSGTERKPADPGAEQLSRDYVGWASERLRDRGKIHLGTTALSINALLEVRDLAEYRLWELCKKRFSVLSIDVPLQEVDPVDLGAAHRERLHRRLERMAYRAKNNHKEAEYSLVLHGPPGSSKTKLAEALSAEMWKFSHRWGPRETRLIRITPADFTRMGEDRLDSEARAIFDLISGVRAVTVLFDEIDDLLRQRNTGPERPRFMDLVVPAMLNRLADLRGACPRQEICFILATNYVENIDSALIRKGRIDASIPVVYPDFESRVAIVIDRLGKNLGKDRLNAKDLTTESEARERHKEIARRTAEWPYLALTSLCAYLSRSDKLSGTKELFESALNDGIAVHRTSFSMLAYQQRWECVQRYSQELLNEYWHHLISQPEHPADCHSLFKNRKIRKRLVDLSKTTIPVSDNDLNVMLNTVMEKQGRLPRN